jgi:superfamily II DNA/RNA helicase
MAEKLGKQLSLQGFAAGAIHGNLSQSQRERALRAFREDKMKILVATDVAARGLDIDNITHVINYDLPMVYQDYIHRIGRTGRGGKTGNALTFIER